MKYSKHVIVLATVIGLHLYPTALGNITNGGFETGDLTGWTFSGAGPDYNIDPFGDPGAVTFEYVRDLWWFPPDSQPPWDGYWDPTEGNYFASLWSTDSAGTDVSTLSQSFWASAGLVLKFDYFFDYGDYAPYYDSAVGTLSWTGGTVTLFEHNTPGHELLDDENIDWTRISYVLPVTGAYTLDFTIADGAVPGSFESILGIDNVQVIPAPAAILLGTIGVGFVGLLRRRRVL